MDGTLIRIDADVGRRIARAVPAQVAAATFDPNRVALIIVLKVESELRRCIGDRERSCDQHGEGIRLRRSSPGVGRDDPKLGVIDPDRIPGDAADRARLGIDLERQRDISLESEREGRRPAGHNGRGCVGLDPVDDLRALRDCDDRSRGLDDEVEWRRGSGSAIGIDHVDHDAWGGAECPRGSVEGAVGRIQVEAIRQPAP